MDQKTMLKVLGPAAAIGVLVLLLGLVMMPPGDPNKKSGPVFPVGSDAGSPAPPAPAGDDSGMVSSAPPADAPEWKPGPGDMKVWDVKEGEGEACKPGAQVVIHYTGWLTNGTKFDSSRDRGQPADFGLGGLIKGWQEGIPGMKPGGIRRLLIPAEWGYGSRGSPPTIPGGATLIFEVKLLSSR